MATANKTMDLFGKISGKVGNVVFYQLNGKAVQRSIGKTLKPPTALQLKSRMAMALTANFLKPVKEFIQIGFKQGAKGSLKSAYNLATSYNRLYALSGAYPDQYMDFSKAMFSGGQMALTPRITAQLVANGLEFTWDPEPNSTGQRWSDVAMLLAYLPERAEAIYMVNGARRNQGRDVLPLPKFNSPMIIETYISFNAADHKSISNSLYTGQFLWERL